VHYEVVFDINTVGYRAWWFPAVILVFAIVAVLVVRTVPPRPGVVMTPFLRAVPHLVSGMAVLITIFSFVLTYRELARLHDVLASGRAQVVEGRVTDFTPMDDFVHKTESFRVGDRWFAYSDAIETGGFNTSSTHGGPIREGLRVRVTYVGGTIVRLEAAGLQHRGSWAHGLAIALRALGLLLFVSAGAALQSLIRRLARYRTGDPTSWWHGGWMEETNPNNYSSEGQALLDKSRTRILAFQVLAFIGVAIFITFTFFAHW